MVSRSNSLNYQAAPHAQLTPRASSYFSAPETHLDPRLFGEDNHLHDEVRTDLLGKFMGHMGSHFQAPDEWSRLWLAGSGASYQWAAAREPGDLDMLVGVDYPMFRRHNDDLARLSNDEINRHINRKFRDHLTGNWSPSTDTDSTYEVTWFANNAPDIRTIKPYAAYDVGRREWTVEPDSAPYRPSYSAQADADKTMTLAIIRRYNQSQTALTNPNITATVRAAHQRTLVDTLQQATALFDDIHENRHQAFWSSGQGYSDPANVRWQSGKASGVIPALQALREFWTSEGAAHEVAMYGVRLPDADDLLLRALVINSEE